MKDEESDKCNNMELFEEIKDKCKLKARTDFFWNLLALLIVIAPIIFFHDSHEVNDIIFFIASVVFLGITIWLTLFSYRFYKRIGNLDTPEQLLQHFEKKNRNLKIIFLVFWLFLIGEKFARNVTEIKIGYEYVLLGIVAMAAIYLMFVLSRDDKLSRKDLEIIEQLRELVKKEDTGCDK